MPRQPIGTFDREIYDLEQETSKPFLTPTMIEQATLSSTHLWHTLQATGTYRKASQWFGDWFNTLAICAGLIGIEIDNSLPTPYHH
jgi:hypothetical protein